VAKRDPYEPVLGPRGKAAGPEKGAKTAKQPVVAGVRRPAFEAEAAEGRQELRIALVMNGGVSLAVWMGGVTRELDRVRTGDGAYGQLLDLTETDACIDVIAGASAGGINGAVLALAIARRTSVDAIRRLWMTNGDIDELLRDPKQRDAPSVLKGDEQLLRRLHEAMSAIGQSDASADPKTPRAPLHLSITGTILKGQLTTYPDRFGAMVPDVTHRAVFRFRRPGVPQQGDPWPDDFAPAGEGEEDLPAARLALAARSSASFPGAFEPSFVPVGSTPDEMHPDMAGIADFSAERWVIDGGVLVNTPFRPALDAIKTLPAERPVRRVLGYVVPNPAAPGPSPDGVPSAAEVVLDAVSRLPRAQSIGRELAEIEENNRSVRRRRDARDHTLRELGPKGLEEAARVLLPAYVRTRRASAADDIVRALVAATGASPFPTTEQVAAFTGELRALTEERWLPHVDQPETFDDVRQWGFAPVENAANAALEVLQRMARAESFGDRRGEVHALRGRMHAALGILREIERHVADYWQNAAERVFLQGETAAMLAAGWARFQGRLGSVALEIAHVLTDAARQMARSNAVGGEADLLRRMLVSLDGGSPPGTLRRLLALDVVQRSSGADLAGIEQEVELVLMSADAANAFRRPARAEGKLAGLQVGHFGAFYKSSWRANDWMWGRLDGADRLVRTLLDPRRVQKRVRAEGVDATVGKIREIACQSATPGVPEWLAIQWAEREIEAAVRREVDALAQAPDDPPLTALAASYSAIRRRVQVEILVEEIPAVANAAAADRAAHAAHDSLGSAWERRYPAGEPLTVARAVEAFKECPIGEETIAREVGSDYFTKISTKGGAVIGSVLGGALQSVKVLKPALALIRGLLLTLYLLARGVADSSKTGTFLVALALAGGGALVAVYAVGTNVPGLLLLLGSVILIAGVLLAVLRDEKRQVALAAAIFFGSAAGYYGIRLWDGRPPLVDPLAAVLAVALMALAAMALGRSDKQVPGRIWSMLSRSFSGLHRADATTRAPAVAEPFRVITFNTAVGNPNIKTEQRAFLELPFYREILDGAPEAPILALQEVGADQAKALDRAARAGRFRLVQIRRPGQGNALLIPERFAFLSSRSRYFVRGQIVAIGRALWRWLRGRGRPNHRQLGELRMWSEARVRDERSKRVFSVFNTHISGDADLRLEQARDLFQRVHAARRHGPVILAGDLNTRAAEEPEPPNHPADSAIRRLFEGLSDMGAVARQPGGRPPIDYLLAAGFAPVAARLYTGDSLQLPGLPTADLISDHYAKEASISFAEP